MAAVPLSSDPAAMLCRCAARVRSPYENQPPAATLGTIGRLSQRHATGKIGRVKLRAVMAVVLLALVSQGPVSAYASTLGAKSAPAGSCSVSLGDCCDCCSTGPAPCCAAACLLSLAALPTGVTLQTPPAYRVAIPDAGTALFVGHDPPRPLRPPIV